VHDLERHGAQSERHSREDDQRHGGADDVADRR
jgi:hypothetical protein